MRLRGGPGAGVRGGAGPGTAGGVELGAAKLGGLHVHGTRSAEQRFFSEGTAVNELFDHPPAALVQLSFCCYV